MLSINPWKVIRTSACSLMLSIPCETEPEAAETQLFDDVALVRLPSREATRVVDQQDIKASRPDL
jgi:hypothetical protein